MKKTSHNNILYLYLYIDDMRVLIVLSASRKKSKPVQKFKDSKIHMLIWETYNHKEHTKNLILQLYMWAID